MSDIQLFDIEGLVAYLTMIEDGEWTITRANRLAMA